MTMRWTFLTIFLVAGAVRADHAKKPDAAKEYIGTWQMMKGVVAGNSFPEAAAKSIRLELTTGKYKLTGAESPDAGTWTANTQKKPAELDIHGTDGPNKGKTFLAICEVKGDTMKVCYDLSGQKRPTKFESKPKTMLFLAEYKRVKP